jgi:hypothetical protein
LKSFKTGLVPKNNKRSVTEIFRCHRAVKNAASQISDNGGTERRFKPAPRVTKIALTFGDG